MTTKQTLLIKGKLTAGQGQIDGVIAKLVLPVPPFARPRLELRPNSSQQADSIVHAFRGRFDAERPLTMSGEGLETVQCDQVYFLQASTRSWSHDIQMSRIKCDAGTVCVSSNHDPDKVATSSQVSFWLTPHGHLRSAAIMEQSFDGTCKRDVVWSQSIPLLPDVQLTIHQEYAWHTEKSGRTIRDGYKVARGELPFDGHDPQTILTKVVPALDDFLTFASLAGSWRCACTGWQVSDGTGRLTKYYRGNITRPRQSEADALETGLVPLEHFDDFVRLAWPRWCQSAFHDALRTVSFAVMPGRSRTAIEDSFIAKFAAFEELVLVYRRQNNLEFTVDDNHWRDLSQSIKQTIRDFQPELTNQQRSMLYDGMAGMKRVSLRRVWERWEADLACELGDLWPVYDSGQRAGLSTIRNKIVHGDFNSDRHFGALCVANDHLRWLLERLVLSLLDWSIEKSEVRPRLLKGRAISMINFDQARRDMNAICT